MNLVLRDEEVTLVATSLAEIISIAEDQALACLKRGHDALASNHHRRAEVLRGLLAREFQRTI
jgi:hypothetical protein